ncbi:Protein of unknown function [Gryllus bimaculatus]|nr:Protein of unknown function [Gryllus bimaculatus]
MSYLGAKRVDSMVLTSVSPISVVQVSMVALQQAHALLLFEKAGAHAFCNPRDAATPRRLERRGAGVGQALGQAAGDHTRAASTRRLHTAFGRLQPLADAPRAGVVAATPVPPRGCGTGLEVARKR